MSHSETSPFVPGARVALVVDGGYHVPTGYKESFVDKVYKNGRFTIRNSARQWRPFEPGHWNRYWNARQTGDGNRDSLRIWDDASDAEITASIVLRRRYYSFKKLQSEIERLTFSSELVTDAVVDWMQAVVLAANPVPKS